MPTFLGERYVQFFGLTGIAGIFSCRLSSSNVLQIVALALYLSSVNVSAQEAANAEADVAVQAEEEAAAEPAEPKELTDTDIADLDALTAAIDANIAQIDDLEKRIKGEDGLVKSVLSVRVDRHWTKTLKEVVALATKVSDKREKGFDTSAYDERVFDLLDQTPLAVSEAIERISDRVVPPDETKSAAEQAAIDEQFFIAIAAVTETYKILLDAITAAEKFGVDTGDEKQFLIERLIDGTTNLSVYLDLTKSTALGLRSGTLVVTDDTELAAKLAITNMRINKVAAAMQANLPILSALGVPTAEYKQQLLSVTGEITTSVFEWDVIVGLLTEWWQLFIESLIEQGPSFAFQLLLFVGIIWLFAKLGALVQRGVQTAFVKSGNQFSRLLREMVLSISRNVVIILGVLIALSQIGISLAPLLTGLGIAGFIIGFALQDSLSNFASGMMILFYRPFDIGDTVQAAGVRGKVSHMSLVNTTIRTFDNQSLIIPNNKIWQDVITNVTDQRQRRVDMVFGITYDEDIDRVEKVLMDVVLADERVLKDPQPMIKVGSFSDSSVDILVRPWVKTDDYWDVLWDLNKVIKQAFDRENITIPFPQRDVHVFQERAPEAKIKGESYDTPDVPEGNEPASSEDDDQ